MLILNHVPILLLSNRAFYDLPMSCFVQVFLFFFPWIHETTHSNISKDECWAVTKDKGLLARPGLMVLLCDVVFLLILHSSCLSVLL